MTQFNRYLELQPDNAEVMIERAYTYQQMKNYENALADYDAALLINPGNKRIYYEKGVIYSSKGEKKKASSSFNKGLNFLSWGCADSVFWDRDQLPRKCGIMSIWAWETT